MADNVEVTAGSGTTIATDQVGSDHYQKVKLADGTADSSTMIAVDVGAKANALRIAPANDITDATYIGDIKFGEALPAGSNAIGKLAANSGVDIGDVDVTSVPAPLNLTGGGVEASALRVTIANDSTGVVSVDDGGGTLTVDGTVTADLGATDNAVLDAIQTAVEVIDNAISGSEMQVDVVAALPAGDNNIGNVDIASSVALDVSAATVTVDGTVTANLGATDNAVLDAIQTAVETLDDAISGSEMQVDVVAALPTGDNNIGNVDIASSVALDVSAATVTVDGTVTANLGATDNAVLDAIQTAVEIIDNVVSGSEAQVDIVAALPAGDNNIGNVDVVTRTVTKAVSSITDWTAVAQNTVGESGAIDVSAKLSSQIHIQAFLDSTTAHTGTEFIVQVSSNSSGDEDWQDYTRFVGLVGTANSEAITNNPLAASSTTITVADTGGNYETPPMCRWIAIEDGTLVNSELILITGFTVDTSITCLDGTTNSHVQNTLMYDIANVWTIELPVGVYRARVVVNNTYDVDGSTLNYKVRLVTAV